MDEQPIAGARIVEGKGLGEAKASLPQREALVGRPPCRTAIEPGMGLFVRRAGCACCMGYAPVVLALPGVMGRVFEGRGAVSDEV